MKPSELLRAARDLPYYYYNCNAGEFIRRSIRGEGTDSISIFNDTKTHAEVMAAYNKAIELAEKEGN